MMLEFDSQAEVSGYPSNILRRHGRWDDLTAPFTYEVKAVAPRHSPQQQHSREIGLQVSASLIDPTPLHCKLLPVQSSWTKLHPNTML